MGLSLYDESFPINGAITLTIADTVDPKAVVPVATVPMRIDSISVASGSATAHVVALTLIKGGVTVVVGTKSIPAGSGFSGVIAVDLIAALLPPTLGGIVLAPGVELDISLSVALGAGETFYVLTLGGYL